MQQGPLPDREPHRELDAQDGRRALREAACRYRAGELLSEDLPMVAAEALAAGEDTPALCDLAGRSRTEDPRDLRDAFEQALAEAGVEPPPQHLARRHALHRMADRLVAGKVALRDVLTEDWHEVETATPEEHALVALLPFCVCCGEYQFGPDRDAWEAEIQAAALAMTLARPARPGC